MLFLAVGSAMSLLYPQAIKIIIDEVVSESDNSLQEKTALINQASLAMLVIFLIQGFATSFRYFLFTVAGERIVLGLRQKLFESLLSKDISFFDQSSTGELMSRISSDCSVLQNTVSVNVSMGIRNIVTAIGGGALMIYSSPWLSVLMLIIVLPLSIGASIFGRFVRKMSRSAQDALAQSASTAEESLSSIRVVRAFVQAHHESSKYKSSIERSFSFARSKIISIAIFSGFASTLGFSAVAAVLWLGGHQVIADSLSVGDLTSFLIYLVIVATSVGALAGLWTDFMSAAGAARRVFELLDDQDSTVSHFSSPAPRLDQSDIEFKEVSFSYPARKDFEVLKSISFRLRAGTSLALVGSSGSGKSSIANLLLGFYELEKGKIAAGGISWNECDPDDLRRQMALVPQDPYLFSGSIAENIAYGRPDANFKDIQEAAKLAYAEEFITRLPGGYEAKVGERGVQLSGGQRQRIAIARAILRRPAVLILDEATSSLDAESEALVKNALESLMKNRTSLIIAHRLSTVRDADAVLVLDRGEILQRGTHSQLVNETGLYRDLLQRQLAVNDENE